MNTELKRFLVGLGTLAALALVVGIFWGLTLLLGKWLWIGLGAIVVSWVLGMLIEAIAIHF